MLKIALSLSLSSILSVASWAGAFVAGPLLSAAANTDRAKEDPLAVGYHNAPLAEVSIAYRVAGNGPLLVVVSPQWGIGASYLEKGLSGFEREFKVVYVNTRGSGSSTRPQDDLRMSTSAMIDDLEALRRYWNLTTLDVLGHSGGGAIVLGFAERYPDRVRKLVMVDAEVTDLYPSPAGDSMVRRWKHDPEHAVWTVHISDPVRDDQTFAQNLRDTLGLYLYQPSRTAQKFATTLPGGVSYWAAAHWEKSDRMMPMPQSQDLRMVKAQSLIIVGRHDFVCPVGMSKRAHEGIKGSKLVIFEKTGHVPWIEEPGKFFPLVKRFLISQPGLENFRHRGFGEDNPKERL